VVKIERKDGGYLARRTRESSTAGSSRSERRFSDVQGAEHFRLFDADWRDADDGLRGVQSNPVVLNAP